MKYICSATIKKLPEHSHEWLGFLGDILKLNPEQQAQINQATVFQDENHIQAVAFSVPRLMPCISCAMPVR